MPTAIHLTHRFDEFAAISTAAAHRAIDEATPIVVHARSRTTDTSVIDVAGVGRVVRKRWAWPRRRDRMKGVLRTTWGAASPARREFEALARLVGLASGPFAPEPLAWTEHRVRGVLRSCILVMTEIPHATDLATWLLAEKPSAARTATLVRLAQRVREMHDARLVDFEMHPRNVLVTREGHVFKVDCAKQRHRTRNVSDADRAGDLAALDVALVRLATEDDRRSFFAAYETPPRLAAAILRERSRIDARESKRLPDQARITR